MYNFFLFLLSMASLSYHLFWYISGSGRKKRSILNLLLSVGEMIFVQSDISIEFSCFIAWNIDHKPWTFFIGLFPPSFVLTFCFCIIIHNILNWSLTYFQKKSILTKDEYQHVSHTLTNVQNQNNWLLIWIFLIWVRLKKSKGLFK